ncbi:CRISPR-associated protein Cas5 family [Anaeromyxobacter dehalogenans 2CP-1]|uniref:CRISPR-associated protein Cas5 family n=1 Tax=Anaeromyxobacter dehalogenans (strain ATCC BAA-258 / DSM 21875 / 2CP-1) TaxID=455488 RepID=B8JDP1_ANAD2|nr:type I-E CRISPR-associated protein Cas5/CasD [Anaeromyxobacter dehalogenans]ACL64136.1 CRISPR-associated protein Cas5 family [Anaeromyxobacter dehalogenans 2CP-1]
MIETLILRFDAPLLAFGGVAVDNQGVVQDFPGLSMVAGLLGNALGFDHREFDRLEALQRRLRVAARRDRKGQRLVDFQTVALGQAFLEQGWTTRGVIEGRDGAFSDATHIRYRAYWADAVYTLAMTLEPAAETPDLDAVERALREPERPLFLGRKACLPSVPILAGRRRCPALLAALAGFERIPRERWEGGEPAPLAAWMPGSEAAEPLVREFPVTDERDWANQLVVGRRIVRQTSIMPPEASNVR